MPSTITFRTDPETEHALGVLTRDGVSVADAVRLALLEAAARREGAAVRRRAVLRLDLGECDGVNISDEIVRERGGSRQAFRGLRNSFVEGEPSPRPSLR